jgi:LmbE family N-acetylglucosaminyl deacetylase
MTACCSPLASILAITAHPDDAELWAGGTLALHASTADVTIAVSRHERERIAEAEAGATILGARLRLLDSPPNVQEITALLLELRPEVVITHPQHDVHPDHRATSTAVLAALPDAVIASGRPERVYTTDTYNSLCLDGPMRATAIIDVTEAFATKMRALDAHQGTQPIASHFAPMAENLARLWGARIGRPHAEAFAAVPVLGRVPAASSL